MFERKCSQLLVPGVDKKSRRSPRALKICLVAGDLKEINQRTGAVAADLGGYGSVLPCFGVVITSEASRRFLNPRSKQPAAGWSEKCCGEQMASLPTQYS